VASQLERDAALNQSKSGAASGPNPSPNRSPSPSPNRSPGPGPEPEPEPEPHATPGEAAGGISEAISELRAALVASYAQREDQLLAQLSEARRRENELLEARRPLPVLRAARDASTLTGDEGGAGEGGAVDESRGAAVARAEAEAHLVAERASAALLSEAREECEGLRRQQRVMQVSPRPSPSPTPSPRPSTSSSPSPSPSPSPSLSLRPEPNQERLREAAKKYQLVLDDMSADRRQLAQQANEARAVVG